MINNKKIESILIVIIVILGYFKANSCKTNCSTDNGGSRCFSKSVCDCEAESGSSMFTCDTDCDTECKILVNRCTNTSNLITCDCKGRGTTCTYKTDCNSADICHGRGQCYQLQTDGYPSFRCVCQNGYSGLTCEKDKPRLTGMDVLIGPYWGGTSIAFTGDTLGAIDELMLHQPLNITFRNESGDTIIAETPSFNETYGQSDEIIAVRLLVNTGIELTTDLNFTYKPNPIIRDLFPRKTIDSGGLIVTVVGENLDSFTETKLVITIEKRNSPVPTEVHKSMCQKHSSTLIKCPTPEIKRSEWFKNRKKRTISRENSDTTLHRAKREMASDDELLEFRLGLEFDGADDFSDLSKTHPHLAFLEVNADPVFEGEQMFTFDPTNAKVIGIKGAEIDSGAVVDDYKVYIGDAQCTEIGLTYDKLYCSPPETIDDIIDRGSTDRSSNEADVTVHIGYSLQYQVGYIQYVTEDPTVPLLTLFIPVVATIGGVLLILFIILIVCACRKSGAKDAPLTAPSVTDIDNIAPTGHGNYYTEQTPKDQYYMVVNKDGRRKGSLPPPDKKLVDGRI